MRNVKMKKRSKEAALLDLTIMEIHEVKCHLSNERHFEAGFGLGGLFNSLCNKLEKCEEKDEEIQSEESDEECEESSEEEKFDWESAHDLVRQENIDIRREKIQLQRDLKITKEIIKDLIRNDHIFPGKIDIVIKQLARCDNEDEESLYALQSGKTMRIKD
jgi:hypothetical protein